MRKAIFCQLWAVGWLLAIIYPAMHPALAEELVPAGPFTEAECINCHTERDPELIAQWRSGAHTTAAGVGCNNCHGNRHEGSGIRARKDQNCIECHSGPASHSYATSKHGAITRLEESKWDWRLPLQRGNYRTPGCSYCHLHDGDHGNTMAPSRPIEMRQWICAACHSPRFVREQLKNGRKQLDIADLKLAESEALISSATGLNPGVFSELRQDLSRHRQNVLLGAGHQSPDYQWWYGQPALDGDLIRVRDILTRPLP